MQLRTALREGACGAVVFTWTDDWWRGGQAVDDWAFGLVDADRRPKPAYRTVQEVFRRARATREHRRRAYRSWSAPTTPPRPSTNASTALERVNYPGLRGHRRQRRVDGRHRCCRRAPSGQSRVINTPNAGLSAARNVGLHHATGEIVAYTDADVRVDPEWLTYLVQPFCRCRKSPPPADRRSSRRTTRGSRNASRVRRARRRTSSSTIESPSTCPGCNCAFRRDALLAIGGFNPVFRRAGDDVDVCWRIQAQGWKIGFRAGGARVASASRHDTRLLAAADWLRRRRNLADARASGQVRRRPHRLARPHLQPAAVLRSLADDTNQRRPVRHRRVSVGLSHRRASVCVSAALRPMAGGVDACCSPRRSARRWSHAPLAAAAAAVSAMATLLATLIKCAALRPALRCLAAAADRPHSRATQPCSSIASPSPGCISSSRSRGSGAGCGASSIGPRARAASRRASAPACLPACGREQIARCASAVAVAAGRDVRTGASGGSTSPTSCGRRRIACASSGRCRQIELDSGWWEDRDLTIANRTWFRLDVRALVEDHGGGKCLHRVAVRSRLTAAAALPLLVAVAAAGALRYAGVSWVASTTIVGDAHARRRRRQRAGHVAAWS